MRHKFLAIFLLIPLLIPFGLVIYHLNYQGDEWKVKIQGFDPRDLLRGQYIQFQYDFESDVKSDEFLCLTGDLDDPRITTMHSSQITSCKNYITNPIRYMNKPQRFYIPEALAMEADKLVREEMIDIRAGIIIKNGDIQVKTLYFKNTSIIDYLRAVR